MSSPVYSKEQDSQIKQSSSQLETQISTVKTPTSEENNQGWFTTFKEGFKPIKLDNVDPNMTELEKANFIASSTPAERAMKPRHLRMIAMGSCIGTGLFIGTGTSLRTGGPAGLLIAFTVVGIQIFCVVQGLAEMAVAFPTSGSFVQYATRFVSGPFGFATAWVYTINWALVMPLELVAASLTIKFWNTEVNSAAWVVIFYFFIMFIHLFGAKAYGEAEFWFSSIKLVTVIGFIIFGIIIDCGGGPKSDGYLGGKYFRDPGAFAHGFKGVCSVLITACFSMQGTELTGLAAAETANPRKAIPSACKQVFWRILIFYMICLTMLGLLVPFTDKKLMGSGSADASASPFVISIKNAGVKGLPSVVNVVIMLSVLSVGNSAVFACSRCVASLANQGFAPKIFDYIDQQGRPLAGYFISFFFGLLCFLAASKDEATIFAWMMAISGLSTLFTWSAICLVHIRFRAALKFQGRSTDELVYTSQTGVLGSYLALILCVLILIAQFWIALFPIGKSPNPTDFFQAYLTAPVWLFFYFFYVLYKRDFRPWIPLKDLDIDEGRREMDMDLVLQEIEEEKAYIRTKPFYYRLMKFLC
ncbi:unnamed protein product [Ambrosiozyma monospora]|uniref:Unnamed protein product n=1 Tax=Ambrosiozyma monospora TaxID=43982 RepID=A0A9W6Z0I4_AMBMO|nr:unnamed protein product [Ambrosiozyma monospora]